MEIVLFVLVGCQAAPINTAALPVTPDSVPVTASTFSNAPSTSTPAGVPAQSKLAPSPVRTQSPNLVPTRLVETRPPSGWTTFSNPDFVQGLTVHNGIVWAATLGGVVSWDLETQLPTLYTPREGLSEIQANDVVDCAVPGDSIIVAHPSGALSVYDLALKKWSKLPILFEDSGTLEKVSALFCDASNQRLLVGSAQGLGIYDIRSQHWKRIGQPEGLKVNTIRAIDVVGQAIWIAAGDKSAFMIQGSTIFPFNGESGFPSGPVNDLSVAPDQSIWFGYPSGLVHYIERKWNSYGAQTSSGVFFYSVDRVKVGPDKRIWIASAQDGICPFDLSTLFCSTFYPGIKGSPVTDLFVDSDGVAYASTNGSGILVLKLDTVEKLAFKRNQILSNQVFDIAESADKKLWVATDQGINILDSNQPSGPWQKVLPSRDDLLLPRVTGLLPAQDGVWFFYDNEPQVSFYNGKKWLHLDSIKGISGPVLGASIDERGYIWFAATSAINIWDHTVMRSYGADTGLPGYTFRTIYENASGMWIGTDRGLLNYQRFRWQTVLPDLTINAMIDDAGGGLLLATNQGLIRYDGSQSYVWIINVDGELYTHPKINTLTRDHQGDLWVGTESLGLLHFDGSAWERFDTTRGLPTNAVRKLLTDHLGAVWIVTSSDAGGALVRYMP